jgi:hypothetical protein
MTTEPLIFAYRALDENGQAYAGAKWYFYESGTTTPQNTYTTAAQDVPHSNPVVADAGGKFPVIYGDAMKRYRGVLKTADDATTIFDIDPVNAATLSQLGFLTAAMFGMSDTGDENEDVTAKLLSLAAAANAKRLPVRLGARQYLTDGTTIEFAVSVKGTGTRSGDTTIKSSTTAVVGPVVRITGPATFEDLRIDGNVSADPVSWNAGNHDSFTGSEGLIVAHDDVIVKNVVVRNVQRAAFKTEIGRARVVFENCLAERCRGKFGDGFIVIGSSHVSFRNCRAHDFTRIGFVSDTYGDSPYTFSAAVSYENCFAEYGHDASILHGGGEYNAGFWSEKSGTVSFRNCRATNISQRGFVMVSGEKIAGIAQAQYHAVNCTAQNVSDGFVVQGLGPVQGINSRPVHCILENCHAEIHGNSAYAVAGGTIGDHVHLIGCSSRLDGDSAARSSIKLGMGTTIVDGFEEIWATENTDYRDRTDTYYGSVSHFNDAPGTAVVRDWVARNDAGDVIGMVLKFLIGAANSLDLCIERTRVRGVLANCKTLLAQDVTWEKLGDWRPATSFRDVRGKILGASSVTNGLGGAVVVLATTKEVSFQGTNIDLSEANDNWIHIYNASSVDRHPKIFFDQCSIRKNFQTGGFAIRVNGDGTPLNTADASHIVMRDSLIFNLGGSTPNAIFQMDSATHAASMVHGRGNLKSGTISNIANDSNKISAAASFENWG